MWKLYSRENLMIKNYKVDFSKIRKQLKFKTKYDVDYGIKKF